MNLVGLASRIIIKEIKRDKIWRMSWEKAIARAIRDTIPRVTIEEAEKSAKLFIDRYIS